MASEEHRISGIIHIVAHHGRNKAQDRYRAEQDLFPYRSGRGWDILQERKHAVSQGEVKDIHHRRIRGPEPLGRLLKDTETQADSSTEDQPEQSRSHEAAQTPVDNDHDEQAGKEPERGVQDPVPYRQHALKDGILPPGDPLVCGVGSIYGAEDHMGNEQVERCLAHHRTELQFRIGLREKTADEEKELHDKSEAGQREPLRKGSQIGHHNGIQ